MVNQHVIDIPCIDQAPESIEKVLPDLYPTYAVTRAMANKAVLNENQSDVDLYDSFTGQSLTNDITKVGRKTLRN